MDFRQLEVFRAIAEELHFGRAAQKLFMAQPSVTQALQKLEADVGARLVHRTSRSVQLTPAGTVFLSEIERVFAAADRAVTLARQAAHGRVGALRIATNYPASRLLLLPLLEDLRRRDTGITTMLRELGSPEQLRALLRGDLDLGLVYGPVDEPGLGSAYLLSVPVVAIVRAGHPLAATEVLSFSDIPRYPYLTGFAAASSVIETAIVAAAAEHGVHLTAASGTTDLASYQLELETTDSIGFSSEQRGEQSRANGMHLLRLGPVEPQLEIHVAWNLQQSEPSVNTVIERLIELAESNRVHG
ncbi:DNA-binding transcriptional LysR family regulator [Glaciihabitans tibetensis]|uniref:DNA-binding transcriptional LysR family regulator n=1 Tax=Glaciihabitans tibetensis TaxID=1266600 RepID=A0A2T0V5T2_9MICO|nr:LysR substrate-binding domain-containing protein [Glaciihabitans tibetensis]PRY65438.1 DNA-binding transcriptional LysR family regulator [Glaciihabitans tibetensis]